MENEFLSISAIRQNFQSKYNINSNLLETTKFIFVPSNMTNLAFFSQSILLPSVSLNEVPVETPYSTTYRAGDKLMYEPITITMLIDEDLRVWEDVYNWMKGLGYPNSGIEHQQQEAKGLYHDMHLIVLKNSYETNMVFKFEYCFPTFLAPVQMTSSGSPEDILTADITLRYDTFKIVRS
jgi:hypothetical protein